MRRSSLSLGVAILLTGLVGAAVAIAAVVQSENLRITLLAQIQPYKLPRTEKAPITILLSGHIEPVKGEVPDQLEGLRVKVNRHATLQSRGLPSCHRSQIQPATTERALANCGDAVIGSGRFWAHIVLSDQGAYPTQGRLYIFNGRDHGRPALFAHIFTPQPFPTSFLIPFSIRRLEDGRYGTELLASLPEALGTWGYVDRIKLTLNRRYRFKGKRLSYFSAACPAFGGAERVGFRLAQATFSFSGNRSFGVEVDKSCGIKE